MCAMFASPAITLFYMRHCNIIAIKELGEDKSGEVKYTKVARVNLSKDDRELTVYPNSLKDNIFKPYSN